MGCFTVCSNNAAASSCLPVQSFWRRTSTEAWTLTRQVETMQAQGKSPIAYLTFPA